MTDATAGKPAGLDLPAGPMLAADGTPLKRSLARALRAQRLRALMLVAPLLLFVLLSFLLPIGDMLLRSVENQVVGDTLPRTVEALADWDPASAEPPGEPVYAALHADLLEAVEAKTHTRLGTRLNYEDSGVSSLMRKTGRDVEDMDPALPFKAQFIDTDEDWGEPGIWQTIKLFSPALHRRLHAERRRHAGDARGRRACARPPSASTSSSSCAPSC